jgi:hypothetical protein
MTSHDTPKKTSNLGAGGRAQKDVADVADNFSIRVTGGAAQFCPVRVRHERAPIFVVGLLVENSLPSMAVRVEEVKPGKKERLKVELKGIFFSLIARGAS